MKNTVQKSFAGIMALLSLFTVGSALADGNDSFMNGTDITDKLILADSASYDENEQAILLCPIGYYKDGTAKYPFEVLDDFEVSFDYKIGGGTSADGIVFAFFSEKDSVVAKGGNLNFSGCGGYGLELDTFQNENDPPNAHVAIIRDEPKNHLVTVEEPRVDDEQWHNADIKVTGNNITFSIDGDILINQLIDFDKTYHYMYFAATTGAGTDNHYIKNVRFTGRAAYSNASEWAVTEMDKAEEYNLIPQALKGKDMTQKINRYEFAALSVALYESITGNTAEAVTTPFTDESSEEVAKAFGLGITDGMSKTEFMRDLDIPREQVATMLARTMTACDPSLNLNTSITSVFDDDAYISDWAKPSVYYMVSKGIIAGIGNNKFAPKNTTTAEEAEMYANATREQAIAMAVRTYEAMPH